MSFLPSNYIFKGKRFHNITLIVKISICLHSYTPAYYTPIYSFIIIYTPKKLFQVSDLEEVLVAVVEVFTTHAPDERVVVGSGS